MASFVLAVNALRRVVLSQSTIVQARMRLDG
jgi:hypothetical protein